MKPIEKIIRLIASYIGLNIICWWLGYVTFCLWLNEIYSIVPEGIAGILAMVGVVLITVRNIYKLVKDWLK